MSAQPEVFDQLAEMEKAQPQELHRGQIVDGLVVQIDDSFVWVDVDSKSEGRIPRDEFETLPEEGSTIAVRLERSEDGIPVFSYKKAASEMGRRKLKTAFEEGAIIRGKVVREVKSGVRVDFGGIEGYVPMRLLDIRSVQSAEYYIGQEFDFKIIEFAQGQRGRNSLSIVASRRELLEAEREHKTDEVFTKYRVGDEVEGVVRNITKSGVFVDIGGFDGLIRLDDLAWKRGVNPRDIVSPQQTIKVRIVQMDPETKRVGLSLKEMTADPFVQFCDEVREGDVIPGTVVKLENFGAFVRLRDGIEGLLHISELSWTRRIGHPKEVLTVGSTIDVKILGIDYDERRISLGFRQLQENPYDSLERDYAINSRHTGRISRLTEFGIFVELPNGVEGLVRKEDIGWERGASNDLESRFVPGEMVEVRVINLDVRKRKIGLGIKQLQENPLEVFRFSHPVGSRMSGTVTRLTDFGAFVDVGNSLEGLIHISNLAEKRVERVADVVKVGDTVEVKVIEIDSEKNKIGLSIKDLERDTERDAINQHRGGEESGTFRLGDVLDLSKLSD
ncbi:MAG TPA: S1 RNA-binding domain-containing protein [Spirochaetota bacterium]|nr:S1 RNA-binding domain-containing protein [Spirochaetota bacterium]HPH01779.1 S1 RNA-binding domain-containing protein [Spirochaetota bacterium]